MKKKKKRVLIAIGILMGYLLSYVILSYNGEYVPSQSGKNRYSFGLSITDCEVWSPKCLYGHLFYTIKGNLSYRGNVLGIIYAPVLIIDQKYIHETRYYFEDK